MKRFFFSACGFCMLFLFSCSDFKDLEMPESVSVKTGARFELPLGNGALSVREKASLEKIQQILEDNISSDDSSGNSAAPAVYEYNPEQSESAVMQYIINYPLKEIPFSIDDGSGDSTDVSSVTIPETNFDAPDFNATIRSSLTEALASKPGTIVIPEGIPGSISDLRNQPSALDKDYVNFNIDTPSFETMTVKKGKMLINIKTPAGVSAGFEMTVGAKIVDADDTAKTIGTPSESKTVSTAEGETTQLSIDLAGATLVKNMRVVFDGSLDGGTAEKTDTYGVTMEPSDDFAVSKVTGLTMSNEELGASGTLPVKKEMDFDGLNPSLKEATIEKGTLEFFCKLPEGWSGVNVDKSYFVIDGSLELADSDFDATSKKDGYVLYRTADLSGKTIKSPATIAPEKTSTYKIADESDCSYLELSLSNATLVFGDEPPSLSINGSITIDSLTELKITLGDLESFSGSEETGLNFSTILSDILSGEKSGLIDNFEFTSTDRASLGGYIFASQPTENDKLRNLSLRGKIYATYDSKSDSNLRDRIDLIGDADTDGIIELKSGVKTPDSFAEEGIISDRAVFSSGNISAEISGENIESLVNEKPDNLSIEYSLALASSSAEDNEISLSGAELEALKSDSKISVSLALVLPLQMKISDKSDVPEAGVRDGKIVIADAMSLIKEEDDDDTGEDILNRDDAGDSEKWLKYADALKVCTMEYTVANNLLVNQAAGGDEALEISISMYAVDSAGNTVTWFGDENSHEKQLDSTPGAHTFAFTKEEVRAIFENYPFVPKVRVEIPADGSVSHVARDSKFGMDGIFRIEFDSAIPVEVWNKNGD